MLKICWSLRRFVGTGTYRWDYPFVGSLKLSFNGAACMASGNAELGLFCEIHLDNCVLSSLVFYVELVWPRQKWLHYWQGIRSFIGANYFMILSGYSFSAIYRVILPTRFNFDGWWIRLMQARGFVDWHALLLVDDYCREVGQKIFRHHILYMSWWLARTSRFFIFIVSAFVVVGSFFFFF